jgi:hypothetical protein
MTKVRFALSLLPILVVSVSAADVSGRWAMTLSADWTRIPNLVCAFSQKGQDLSGTCRAAADPNGSAVDVIDGRIDAERFSCRWNIVTPDGEPWTYALTGTVDANGTMMKGSFKLSSRSSEGEGTFTAKKQ